MHGLMCFEAFKRLTGLVKYKWLLITSNIKQLYHYGTKELRVKHYYMHCYVIPSNVICNCEILDSLFPPPCKHVAFC